MRSREPRLFEDTRDLLVAFSEAGVEFVVVGAHALAAHGAVLGREALIKNKRASGRTKDLLDVRALEAESEPREQTPKKS